MPADPVVAGGSSLRLSAWVLDQRRAVMSGVAIVWSSNDLSTATVDATTGNLLGVAGGEVEIVARAGALSANVNAVVTYPVGIGQTTLRLRAATETVWNLEEIQGFSHFGDRLGTDAGDYSLLASSSEGDYFDPAVTLVVFLPGRPVEERIGLSTVDLAAIWGSDSLLTVNVPYLVLDREIDSNSRLAYVSTGGWTLSEYVELPVAPGGRSGLFWGRLMANVTGYYVEWDASGEPAFIPLGDRATLYADISTGFYHRALAVVSLAFNGGPFPGAADVSDAAYRSFNSQGGGDLTFELERDDDEIGELNIIARRDPAVGLWSISAVDPHLPSQVDYWAGAHYWGDPLDWYSLSGTLRIDAAVQPKAVDLSGELRGTFTVTLAGWLPGAGPPSSTGQQMASTGTFHVPWWDQSAQTTPLPKVSRARSITSRWLAEALNAMPRAHVPMR